MPPSTIDAITMCHCSAIRGCGHLPFCYLALLDNVLYRLACPFERKGEKRAIGSVHGTKRHNLKAQGSTSMNIAFDESFLTHPPRVTE